MRTTVHKDTSSTTPKRRPATSLTMSRLAASCNYPYWMPGNPATTQSADVGESDAQAKPPFNIVIVFDDFACGRLAVETCSRLIAEFKGNFTVRVKTWSFAVLRNAAINLTAASDAAKARMVVVATSSEDLPPAVKKWIKTWARWKSGPCPTLVGCLNAVEAKEDCLPAETYLRTVAVSGGMELFLEKIGHSGESGMFCPV